MARSQIISNKKRVILNSLIRGRRRADMERQYNHEIKDEITSKGQLLGYVEEYDDTYGKKGWLSPVYVYGNGFYVLQDLGEFQGPYNSLGDIEREYGPLTDG